MTHAELVSRLTAIAKRGHGTLSTSASIRVTSPIVLDVGEYFTLWWAHRGPPLVYAPANPADSAKPWLTCVNTKLSEFDGVRVTGGVWEFLAEARGQLVGSTNRVTMTRCDSAGLRIMAPNGEDACDYRVQDTDFTGQVIIAGSNNLEHTFSNVNANGGFDLSAGGSSSTLDQCGGSNADVLFKFNSGYVMPTVRGGRSEHCHTVFQVAGGGDSGFGLNIDGREDVDCVSYIDFYGRGLVKSENSVASGVCAVTVKNDSLEPGVLDLRSLYCRDMSGRRIEPLLSAQGNWTVTGHAVQ